MSGTTISKNEATAPAQSKKALWLKQARQMHLYLGTFFAPSILFFALTGALQLFGLHQGHPGEAYQPPVFLEKLGALHKNQNLAVKGPGPGPGQAREPRRPSGPTEKRPQNPFTAALKGFFLATSLGLVFTTLLGIYMAFKFNRSRAMIWSLLILGTAIPAALIAMML